MLKCIFLEEAFARAGFAGLNVWATCNAIEEFTSVDVSWPGSVYDNVENLGSAYKNETFF